MALITVNNLTIGYRGPPLLDDVSCQIEPGQKIGLLGRNGAGKTTLLRILSGEVEPDHGKAAFAPGTTVSLLPQGVPLDLTGRAIDIVTGGSAGAPPDAAWQIEQRARQLLTAVQAAEEAAFESLSSGMKRRVLLARALVKNPDVLLLDEPTNHLDVDSIQWLEDFLSRFRGTLIFVTHDRRFLQALAGRILEIDRGRLFDWSCDYETFLVRKADALAAEEKQNALFDKRLAEEEAWIRQGIKARRTRNEGRVRALEAMRRERSQRQASPAKAQLAIQEGQRSGTLVVGADKISYAYGQREIFRNLSTNIMRGDKVGVIGPNGVGKTTLLRVLLGQLPPQTGTVRLGTNLQIAYFDQLRQQLDEERTIQDNVGDGYDTVNIQGTPRHIIGYLQDFLFSPERARTPIRFLSGGERNRVLLAKLFAKPANLLVLDEPTNDLDVETLEMLEQRLVEFAGTVLIVSHDRAFLDNVVTSTLVYEEGEVREYVGGYDDWLRQRAAKASTSSAKKQSAPAVKKSPKAAGAGADTTQPQPRRRSFKERHELSSLPASIEVLEAELAALHQVMAQPEHYRQASDIIAQEAARVRQLETELAAAYRRWDELEQLGE